MTETNQQSCVVTQTHEYTEIGLKCVVVCVTPSHTQTQALRNAYIEAHTHTHSEDSSCSNSHMPTYLRNPFSRPS